MNNKKRKKDRLKNTKNSKKIGNRTYNMIFGITIIYGLILNYIICVFGTDIVMTFNPGITILIWIILIFIGTWINIRSKNPIISFLGYNMLVLPTGVVLSACVSEYGGTSSAIIQQAFLYTSIITIIMTILSMIIPSFFEKIKGMLSASLIAITLASIYCLINNIDTIILSWIGSVIFSLYIGYDMYASQQYPKTIDNAIDCAMDVYVDIINLFLNISDTLDKSQKKKK